MEDKAKIIEYQMLYPGLTKEFQEYFPDVYQLLLLNFRTVELKKGYRAIKTAKATNKGTEITYCAIETGDEFIAEFRSIQNSCYPYMN
jgi:hypothetical protein